MLELELIKNVEDRVTFSQNYLYRFQVPVRDAYEVSANLVKLAEEMYQSAIMTDEEGD